MVGDANGGRATGDVARATALRLFSGPRWDTELGLSRSFAGDAEAVGLLEASTPVGACGLLAAVISQATVFQAVVEKSMGCAR